MIRITCQQQLQSDGSLTLTANPSWRFKKQHQIQLEGQDHEVWNILSHFAAAPREQQKETLESLSPESRQRLVTCASLFQQGGFLELTKGLNFDSAPESDVPRLYKIHLEVTHSCNFACTACYLGPKLRRPGDRPGASGSTEQWLKLIHEAGDLGCSFATLTGGEPFLRKDAFALLAALTERGIICEINTNASCITRENAKKLSNISISVVAVSLYGCDTETAAKYTHNKTSFAAALRGIKNMLENSIPVSVKYFATKDSIDGYEKAQEALEPLGVKAKLIGHAIHGDLFNGKLPDPNVSANMPRPPLVQEGDLPCHPGIGGLAIEPDGSVRACPKLSVYFGNAFDSGLPAIWRKSQELGVFRAFWNDYCHREGYVPGVVLDSLCPASRVLSREGGLHEFKSEWRQWNEEM